MMAPPTVSRRNFLRLSAGTLGTLGAVSPLATQAGDTGPVSLVIDPADRAASDTPVAWAVDQLEAALSRHGLGLQRFRSLHEVPARTRCIVAATRDMPIATQTLRQAGFAAPRAAESLAVLTA